MVSESSATRMARSQHDKEQGEAWRSTSESGVMPRSPSIWREPHEPGRGREADRPGEIPPPGWNDIIWRVIWSISADRILSTSGGVAFFALLTVFPAIATIVSLYGLFADAGTIASHLSVLSGILPEGVLGLIEIRSPWLRDRAATRSASPLSSDCWLRLERGFGRCRPL